MAKQLEIQGVIGANVKRLRLSLPDGRNTIKEFAGYVGVGNGTIDRIEKGRVDPQVSSLVKIASRFGLEPWHLFIPNVDHVNKPHLLTSQEMAWHLKIEKVMEDMPRATGSESGAFMRLPPPNKKVARKFRRAK